MSDACHVHARLMAAQRAWADAREIDVDADGRLAHWADNLLAPSSSPTRSELSEGSAGARDPGSKPGRLHDLGSGLVLAANVFDAFRDRCDALVARVPQLVPRSARMSFSTRLPLDTASDGLAAEVDLLLHDDDGVATAILPLFVEPFTDVDPRVQDALARDVAPWRDLPGCALLARDLRANPRRFRRLAVGRVLEATLAMSRHYGKDRNRVAVIWFDAGGRTTHQLRQEIDHLRMRIGGEVEIFESSWQWLVARLAGGAPCDEGYARALHARYFDASRSAA